ncbi:MAG: RusA family crossover junction endodeoxyribonuclease [Candidatus Sungbacteria bacterium]|nr:RusA family crossover junction endodeoxyribonuclease [Candidatus Sungbacteria bacterium]
MATFDYQFGLTVITPSKQDNREGEKIAAFRTLVEKTITSEIMKLSIFPSKKEVAVFIMQFFLSKKDYDTRDVDNMSKTVMDCLKGKLYIDDVQVRTLLVSKKVSPRVPSNFIFVGIRELHGETDIDVVKSMLMQQAITLYQTSIK